MRKLNPNEISKEQMVELLKAERRGRENNINAGYGGAIIECEIQIIDAILAALEEKGGVSEGEREEMVGALNHDWRWMELDGVNPVPSIEMRDKICLLILGNQGGAVTDKIICLCGSTRFTEQMLVKQWELTKQGYVVLSWCALPEDYFSGEDKAHIGDQEGVKEIVDAVHFRKIELANEVFVVNIGGYIGESTRNEIEYAKKLGKKINYLEPRGDTGKDGR